MSVDTAHMVYFCAFARSEIVLENARKSGVGRGQFDAGVNGLIHIYGPKFQETLLQYSQRYRLFCILPFLVENNMTSSLI